MSIPVKVKDDGSLLPTFFGFYGTQRRKVGDKFEIKSIDDFSEAWMERLDVDQVNIKDTQYDPSDEVDEAKIAQMDEIVDQATGVQAQQADPQQAGPSAKKKAAKKKQVKKR